MFSFLPRISLCSHVVFWCVQNVVVCPPSFLVFSECRDLSTSTSGVSSVFCGVSALFSGVSRIFSSFSRVFYGVFKVTRCVRFVFWCVQSVFLCVQNVALCLPCFLVCPERCDVSALCSGVSRVLLVCPELSLCARLVFWFVQSVLWCILLVLLGAVTRGSFHALEDPFTR